MTPESLGKIQVARMQGPLDSQGPPKYGSVVNFMLFLAGKKRPKRGRVAG